MLRRYFNTNDAGSTPAPTGARVDHVDLISGSPTTVTEKTFITGGPVSGTITFKVSALTGTGDPGRYFNFNGVNAILGDTFVIATDALGNCNYTTIAYAGATHISAINATVQIFAVSSGIIGTPATRSYSRIF